MKYFCKPLRNQGLLKPLPFLLFFLIQGIAVSLAVEPSKTVVFDLSKETPESVKTMAFSYSGSKSVKGKKNSDPSETVFQEGSIFPKNPSNCIFYGGPFSESIPTQANLCLEGVFNLATSSQAENQPPGVRFGFKIPGQNTGVCVKFGPLVNQPEESKVRIGVRVFSGPAIYFKQAGEVGSDGAVSEIIYDSTATSTVIDTQGPIRVKLIAHGATSELSVWINDQFIFKGKSAYKGVAGELCPLNLMDGLFVRFEYQRPFSEDKPASATSILCYYTLD